MSIGVEVIAATVATAAAKEAASVLLTKLTGKFGVKARTEEDNLDVSAVLSQLEIEEEELGTPAFAGKAVSAATDALISTAEIRVQKAGESKHLHWLSIGLIGFGCLIIGAGLIAWLISQKTEVGAISTFVGLAMNGVGGYVLKLRKEANEQLELIRRDEQRIKNAVITLEIAKVVEDPTSRDQAVRKLMDELMKPVAV